MFPEGAVTQAAEPAAPGAADGLQGEGDDGGDDAEAGGAGAEETPAGGQEGGGQQEPDHREADQNQQGQDQEHEGEEVQAEPEPHGALQRQRPGDEHLLPLGGSCTDPHPPLCSSCTPPDLRGHRLPQHQEVRLLQERGAPLQPGVLQEEHAAGSERSVNSSTRMKVHSDYILEGSFQLHTNHFSVILIIMVFPGHTIQLCTL